MAKNRAPVNTVEPVSGEEHSSSGEETGSESELEIEPSQPSLKMNQPSPPPSSQLPSSSAEEEEEEEEEEDESDSDSDTDIHVTPIVTKVMDDAKKPATQTKSTGKRPIEAKKQEDAKNVKKPKINPEGLAAALDVSKKKQLENKSRSAAAALDSGSKRAHFKRLFSEEDDIAILKGMLDYVDKNQVSPTVDPHAFFEFIQENLHIDLNGTQLLGKMKRLKKKYMDNKIKGRNLSKPHDKEAFEWSEKIWGKEVVANGNGSGSVKAASQKSEAKTIANGSFKIENGKEKKKKKKKSGHFVSIDDRVLSIGAELFEGEEHEEDEAAQKWRNLMLEEMEVRIKQINVMRARATLVLDALKSQNQ